MTKDISTCRIRKIVSAIAAFSFVMMGVVGCENDQSSSAEHRTSPDIPPTLTIETDEGGNTVTPDAVQWNDSNPPPSSVEWLNIVTAKIQQVSINTKYVPSEVSVFLYPKGVDSQGLPIEDGVQEKVICGYLSSKRNLPCDKYLSDGKISFSFPDLSKGEDNRLVINVVWEELHSEYPETKVACWFVNDLS